MNSIKMAKLDLYTLKPQAIVLSLVFVAVMILFSFMSPSYDVLGFTCAWILPLFSATIFQIQEKDSLDLLYGTLSIKQKDIVEGRYLSIVTLFILSILASLVIYTCFSLIYQGSVPSGESMLFGASLSLLLFSIIAGLQLPTFFKVGYTKGKFITWAPFFVILILAAAVTMITPLQTIAMVLSTAVTFIQSNQLLFTVLFTVLGIVILLLSYSASLVAYRKRK